MRCDGEYQELIIDNFAGGGGASTGIELAIGRSVDIAINHDPAAIAMHKVNHPETKHYCESVWDVDPKEVTQGRPVALCWLSPDCKHFSKAKGGKPVDKHIRGLAWIAIRWAAAVRPRVIMLENVEEFKTWGPLLENGKPDPTRKGKTFNAFINALKRQGYKVDWRELRACDYGAPTIRKRFFLIARCDGRPIVWPKPTHGDPNSREVKSGKLKPWRTAAEIIDWSLPCPSIFERERPLAENTMRRIAKGLQKFVFDNPEPFIIKVNHSSDDFRGQAIDEPMQTITAKNGWGIVTPFIAGVGGRAGQSRPRSGDEPLATITTKADAALVTPIMVREFGCSVGHEVDSPLGTITAGGGGHSRLVAAFLAKHYGGNYDGPGVDLNEPTPTITTKDHNAVVTSHLIKMYGTNIGSPVTDPAPTVTAGGLHLGEVRAFLMKYYGTGTSVGQDCNEPLHTITTKDRFGLVTIHGQDYQIVDIGMRMLEPHELFAAQGFPTDYIIDRDADGKPYSKAAQVARCGNAVPPPFAEALTRANLPELCGGEIEQPEPEEFRAYQVGLF
jgi:DNA (cytosine-5)-methyltransferase 1